MPQSTWAQLVPRKPWLDVPEEMIGEVVPTKPKPFLEEPEPVPVEEPRFEQTRERKNAPTESKKEKKKRNKKNKQKKAEEVAMAALAAGAASAAPAAAAADAQPAGKKKKNKKKKQNAEDALIPKAQPTRSEVDKYMDQVKEQVANDVKKAKENKKKNKKKAGTPAQQEEEDTGKSLSAVPLAIGGVFILLVVFAALLQGGMVHL